MSQRVSSARICRSSVLAGLAIASLTAAVAIDPSMLEARFNLALVYAKAGRRAEAASAARDLLARAQALPAQARAAQAGELGQLRLSVKQLEHALAARVVVEQAIGVLTERQHGTPREAFERLRKVARSRGRRVHDLAKEVVQSASQPGVPLPPELAGRR